MKIVHLLFAGAMAASSVLAADKTVTFKNVHLCCDECVRGAERSLKGVSGVEFKADKEAETVTLTAADAATMKKAADALAAGGYFGAPDDKDFKPVAKTGAKGEKVQSIIVKGAHLCCGSCVKAVDRAAKATPGVTGHTAKKNSKTFFVTGDFNDQAFFDALHKEGLSGSITTEAAPEPPAGSPPKARDDH